jgi:hypothetical protein
MLGAEAADNGEVLVVARLHLRRMGEALRIEKMQARELVFPRTPIRKF